MTLRTYGESGIEPEDANGYVTVAEADDYFADRFSIAWLQVADKGAAIVKATSYLDNHYRLRWRGTRATEEQALAWPRESVIDEDGFEVDDETIPERVKEATFEAALLSVSVDLHVNWNPTDPRRTSRAVSVGPISKSETYDQGYRDSQPIFDIIDRLLYALTINARVNFLARA